MGQVTAAVLSRQFIFPPLPFNHDAGWGKYVLIPGDDRWIEDVDWVVAVIGRRSREDLFLKFKSAPELLATRIERVGDCVAPRLLQSVILEAFTLAAAL